MNTENPVTPQDEKVVVYETPDGEMRVDVRLDQETVWLTQRQMSEVFQTSSDNVGLHLKNVFADGELEESATTEDFSVVQAEGKRQVRRALKHYNLDAIISVGYRVNSKRGVQFRQWATHTLRDHLVRGYTVHKQRPAPLSHVSESGKRSASAQSPSPDGAHAAHRRKRTRRQRPDDPPYYQSACRARGMNGSPDA